MASIIKYIKNIWNQHKLNKLVIKNHSLTDLGKIDDLIDDDPLCLLKKDKVTGMTILLQCASIINEPCAPDKLQLLVKKMTENAQHDDANIFTYYGNHQCNFGNNAMHYVISSLLKPKTELYRDFIVHDMLGILLINSYNPNATNNANETPLLYLLKLGVQPTNIYDIVLLLLENGTGVNTCDNLEMSVLMYAIVNKQSIDIIELLLRYGANVNMRNNNDENILLLALKYTDRLCLKKLLKCLLNAGANVNRKYINNQTFIMKMLKYLTSCHHLITLLLRYNVNFDTIDDDGKNALIYAIEYGHDDETVILIAKNTRNIDNIDKFMKTSLMYAIQYKKSHEVIRALTTTYHANPDIQDSTKNTAILHAIKLELPSEIIITLVQNSTNVNLYDLNEMSALMYALKNPNYRGDVAKILISKGADPNVCNALGENTIISSIMCEIDINSIEMLIRRTIDINKQNNDKLTTLMIVSMLPISDYYLQVIKLLLSHPKINVNIPDNYGNIAIWYILNNTSIQHHKPNILKCISLLLQHKSNLNHINNDGINLLDIALSLGDRQIVALFMEYNCSFTTGSNKIILNMLHNSSKTKIVEILLNYNKCDEQLTGTIFTICTKNYRKELCALILQYNLPMKISVDMRHSALLSTSLPSGPKGTLLRDEFHTRIQRTIKQNEIIKINLKQILRNIPAYLEEREFYPESMNITLLYFANKRRNDYVGYVKEINNSCKLLDFYGCRNITDFDVIVMNVNKL